jgi:hypothetical protein
VSPWNWTTCPCLARASNSNILHWPSHIWMQINTGCQMSSSRVIPHMVTHWCSSIIAPGTQNSRTHRKDIPPGWCGFNGSLPDGKVDYKKNRLSVTVCTRQVCSDVEV